MLCVLLQILVSIRNQVNTGPVLQIPILISIVLAYKGSLFGLKQCVVIYEMDRRQFANSKHILMTTKSPFSFSGILKLCLLESWNVNVLVSKALWFNFCCLNVLQAVNKIDVIVSIKRFRHFL